MVAERFGANLARCRNRAGISQEELSARTELHRNEIGQLERGLRVARLDTLIKLAGGLEVEPSELLEGLHWRPGATRTGNFESRDRP
jgi:transcriptional regulator with XRE-family HTH domain